MFEVTFLGTNGSCTYSTPDRQKYGCNTSCVVVRVGEETLIFDAGSGICGFGGIGDAQREHLRVFFSHYHIDHIGGLPFFSALYDARKRIDLYGGGGENGDFYSIVDGFLSPPLHPIGVEVFRAKCSFHTLAAGETLLLSDGVLVRTHTLTHPGGSMGYRVEYEGKALCYCTDVELSHHENDSGLLEFMRDADLLILDAFFGGDTTNPDWGHSSWRESAEWAKRAGAKKLALFHYGFSVLDTDIDSMEEKAKKIFPHTFASADRMWVKL